MAQVIALEQSLRDKIKAAKEANRLNKSALDASEQSILLDVVNCDEAPRVDRLLAAKTLFEIADNQWRAIQKIADRYKLKWLELEHTEQVDRNINNTTNDILKSVAGLSNEDLMKVVAKMMAEKAKD